MVVMWNSNLVFWSDTYTKKVYSADYNRGNIKEILTAAVHNVQNLAVDWINFKLYVLEAMVERIDMCDFDGGNRVTLVAENLETPHGLALDPTVG
ncbi:low-density lipoprotein receptor-related protein 2-like [Solea solea]|uniref:low-density lipoprotein receptor-related protein 2-like n=1 Tax=Solea solea TaxID=90069 RepID=UPI002729B9A1|nr:low-density lipoprotein receptor-related protein 2-like [Solea solea]